MKPSAAFEQKLRSFIMAKAADNDPRLEAMVSRVNVPVTDAGFLNYDLVKAGAFTRADVAIYRPNYTTAGMRAYVAGVDAAGGHVYAADITRQGKAVGAFLECLTLAGAVYIALAFDGTYKRRADRYIEFITEPMPWVLWINGAGELYADVLGSGNAVLLSNDAVAVAAAQGASSLQGDFSQGFVVAYAASGGAVITRQLYRGVWEDGQICEEAPANVVDLSLCRSWDYRLHMMVQTAGGAVYWIKSNSAVSGTANVENLKADVKLTAAVYETIPNYAKTQDENIAAALDLSAEAYTTIAPSLVSAANIDDGNGNFGVLVRAVFSGPVYDLAGNGAAFAVVGGANFPSESIEYDPADPDLKTLIIRVFDFNNAALSCTLTYTPGSIKSGPGVTALGPQSVAFTATNLVPTNPPAVTNIETLDNYSVRVTFDGQISSVNMAANAAAFAVSGNEPAYSPGGADTPKTYIVNTVEAAANTQNVALSGGTNTDTQYTDGKIKLGVL